LGDLTIKWKAKPIGTTITTELLLGGVFSTLVKTGML
jgi:hypothetical protein